MLVIFGIENKLIFQEEDNSLVCKNCNSVGLTVSVFEDYLHVFWLPVFPVKNKTVLIRCYNCGNYHNDLELKELYGKAIKAPLYLYVGLIVLLLLIGIILLALLAGI